jgi:protein-tyrosine phosphatase
MHPTWEIAVKSSALVLTPCPGTKGIDLEASLLQLQKSGVKAVVSAVSQQEMLSKGVESLGAMVKHLGMEWFHLVIEDDAAPNDCFEAAWAMASPELHAIMDRGGKLAMHCMGGSGRTGLLAARFLLELDWPLEMIMTEVRALRPTAFSKEVQLNYIHRMAERSE